MEEASVKRGDLIRRLKVAEGVRKWRQEEWGERHAHSVTERSGRGACQGEECLTSGFSPCAPAALGPTEGPRVFQGEDGCREVPGQQGGERVAEVWLGSWTGGSYWEKGSSLRSSGCTYGKCCYCERGALTAGLVTQRMFQAQPKLLRRTFPWKKKVTGCVRKFQSQFRVIRFQYLNLSVPCIAGHLVTTTEHFLSHSERSVHPLPVWVLCEGSFRLHLPKLGCQDLPLRIVCSAKLSFRNECEINIAWNKQKWFSPVYLP